MSRANTMRSRVLTSLLVAAVLAALGACGSPEPADEEPGADPSIAAEAPSSDYRVVLTNAIVDTLSGDAAFGTVYEPEEQAERFVIRLASSFDFAGGLVLARSDTLLPPVGTYDLGVNADSLVTLEPNQFYMFYREGMLRDMRATSGELTLTTVTDTLVAGTFDAVLRGRVANIAGTGGGAEVRAVGRFRAERGLNGFVIGL